MSQCIGKDGRNSVRGRWSWVLVGFFIGACGGTGGGNPEDSSVEVGAELGLDFGDLSKPDVAREVPDGGAPESGPPDLGDEDTYQPPPGTQAIFDPASEEFLGIPFPSDAFWTWDGRLDLSRFPNPDGIPLVEYLVSLASEVLDGWSVVPVVYFAFEGPLDAASLPESYLPPEGDAPVQMVDVTPGPTLGRRIPLLWRIRDEPGLYLPAHTLMVRPVWGFTLDEGHSYAVFVTRQVQGKDGRPLARPSAFHEALNATLVGYDALLASLQPLRDLFVREPSLADEVVVGTVFTVGHPTAELRRIRDFLYNQVPAPSVIDIQNTTKAADTAFYRYEGHYLAPNFLKGTPPYLENGDFEFDESGSPVVQFMEMMRFVLIIPKGRDMPPRGWPIVIHSHGTGGKYDSHVNNPGKYLAQEGLAGIGIDQPLHGNRVSPPLSQEELALYSFNFLNVRAGRTVQRQSVPDNISLLRLIQSGNLIVPAHISGAGREERFDPDAVVFFGHSQGGLTGGMLFGVEDRMWGGVLSGAGGGLSLTLMLRKDYVDIADLIRGFLNIADPTELTEDHPVIQLMQMLIDASDPIAYANSYFAEEAARDASRPRSVLMTEGMLDEQTPPATTEALAASAGIPILSPFQSWPLGLTLKGVGPVTLPVGGNLVLPGGHRVTGVLVQFADEDHFAVFNDATARDYYLEFLRTLATKHLATVGAE